MRKFKAILKIIFCKKYILITENKGKGNDYDYTISPQDGVRHLRFLHGFLEDDPVITFYEVLNNQNGTTKQ